jgi:xanthine dehydrogenase accessory factor
MPIYGADREILETAVNWIGQGFSPLLVTVVRTWGSSPRPVGSLMLMREDGQHAGSVSGGCVEEDLVSRYRSQQLSDSFPSMIDYGINHQEASRLGLPCGGRLELLIEQLHSVTALQVLLEKLQSRQLVARRVCLNSGEVSLHPASAAEEFSYAADTVSKIFGPSWQLLLIGAGHLSQCVAQVALMLDYHVFVCDPRDAYSETWTVEGAELLRVMPDDAVRACASHPRSVVVALTHDPKLDDMALLDALNSEAFYVGALGSKRNSELRRERLEALGVTEQQLRRLHAPVGLAIGSRTPAEIAVSIMAEVTSRRNQATRRAQDAASAA